MKVITDLTRIPTPTTEFFMNEFVIPKKPVIITGALDSWKAKDWNLHNLKEKIGKKEFSFRTEAGRTTGIFSEMIEQIENATTLSPAPYLRNVNLLKAFPELKNDIFPNISYMENNWRTHWAWPKNWPEHVTKDLFELFISSKGTSFPRLHIDYWGMETFVAQLSGTKEFVLYSPDDTPFLYANPLKPLESTVEDFINPDFEKYPKLHDATQYRVQLNSGDLLYNPGFWHTTRTLETSITIIMAYWTHSNYPIFVNEIERVYKDCNKIKKFMMVQYFKGMGHIITQARHP